VLVIPEARASSSSIDSVEVSGIDLVVFAGEGVFLTIFASEKHALDKTKRFLETIANLSGDARLPADNLFVLSGIKLVGVSGEELIVVTGE